MSLQLTHRIGKYACLLALDEEVSLNGLPIPDDFTYCVGKVGTMDLQKIVAAIETAAKNEGLIDSKRYREIHALYHTTMEAIEGVTRGSVQLGTVLRTVGLRFSIVRGKPYSETEEGEWIAVALYGTIGAPVKGAEHEAFGLGINHI